MFVGERSYGDMDTPKKRMIKVKVNFGFLLQMLNKIGNQEHWQRVRLQNMSWHLKKSTVPRLFLNKYVR